MRASVTSPFHAAGVWLLSGCRAKVLVERLDLAVDLRLRHILFGRLVDHVDDHLDGDDLRFLEVELRVSALVRRVFETHLFAR
jgi:hypothetical protein